MLNSTEHENFPAHECWNANNYNGDRVISYHVSHPGPGCSKLTMSLVNVSLKFQTLISEIWQYFLLKKWEKLLQCKSFSHLFNKKFSVFAYKGVKQLMSWPLNELVKLTMLWTTGPWCSSVRLYNRMYNNDYITHLVKVTKHFSTILATLSRRSSTVVYVRTKCSLGREVAVYFSAFLLQAQKLLWGKYN